MSDRRIEIGRYVVHGELAATASAAVYSGVHVETGTPVAVKVLVEERARDPQAIARFRREVHTQAGLDHPAITATFDYGEIPEQAEEQSNGQLPAGAPYLVMELAAGALTDRIGSGSLSWDEARAVLTTLLEGLAFAHAHGVIHRDIKPGNVLRFGPPSEPVWKLADFGIAVSIAGVGHDVIAGTPLYMAPEQFLGQWRDFTQSTDLYAVGCVAYELATGEPPFDGSSIAALAHAHVNEAVPEVAVPAGFPAGFATWVRRLLSKDQVDRFMRAPDALAALSRLSTASAAFNADSGGNLSTVPLKPLALDTPPELPSHDRVRNSIPDVPATWRRDLVARSNQVVGASSRLFGIRTIPFIGRESERDALWEALRASAEQDQPRFLFIEGPSGTGKTRLMEWIAHRAEEIGAASTIRAFGSRGGSGAQALVNAIARSLRADGLEGEELERRIDRVFEVYKVQGRWRREALHRLLTETGKSVHGSETSPLSRYALLGGLFRYIASWRPLIVCIDDIQWAEDTLAFIRWFFSEGRDEGAILFVGTAQSEALADLPAADRMLREIEGLPRCERVLLEDLSPGESRTLLRELLRLDEELVRRTASRVGGNPLFAVQLVGSWLERGNLRYSDEHFQLDEGVWPEIPDSVRNVWAFRLEKVLAVHTLDDARSLEVAAAIGSEVQLDEWLRVCTLLGLTPSATLVDELVGRRLAQWTKHGWRFIHGMMRETFVDTARSAERWEGVNATIADFLESSPGREPEHVRLARVGRHRLEAREVDAALAAMYRAADRAQRFGDYHQALELLRSRERAIRLNGRPLARSAEGWILEARIHLNLGDAERARSLGADAAEAARTLEDRGLWARARMSQALTARALGRLPEAERWVRDALPELEALGDELEVARARLYLAGVYGYAGRVSEATDLLDEVRGVIRERGAPDDIASLAYESGYIHVQRDEPELALELLEEASKIAQEQGQWGFSFGVLLTVADAHRLQGNRELAEHEYRRAAEFFEAIGDRATAVCYLNLSVLKLEARDFEGAKRWARYAQIYLERAPQEQLAAALSIHLLACAAHDGDWREWDSRIAAVPKWLERTTVLELDDAIALEVAAEVTDIAGQRARGRTIWELVRLLWEKLENPEGVARADRQLAAR